MLECFDSLNQEIINVQLLDLYFKNNELRTETVFFTEDYLYQLERTENLLKYYENSGYLDSQKVEDENYEYTLDDVLELLVADLDLYPFIYKVPTVKINNTEWELFFTTLANYYQKQEFSYFYMDDMIALNRMAIARSMIYEEENITLQTYISSLKYIESDVISISNIKEMAKKLEEVFGIDALSLLVNKDGSCGCVGKDFQLLVLEDENQDKSKLNINQIKQQLQEKGYKISETLKIPTTNDEANLENSFSIDNNVVDFKSYKMKIRK